MNLDTTSVEHPWAFPTVAASEASAYETQECDYLVIGAGVGGLAAAARAAEAGVSVILLEKAEEIGGSSPYVEAHFALDTVAYVKEQGRVTWTKKEAYDYFMFFNNYRPDAKLVSSFLDHLNEPFDWFIDKGAEVGSLLWSLAGEGTGAGLFFAEKAAGLAQMCQDVMAQGNVTALTSSPATNLVIDEGGACVGALATTPDGTTVYVKSRATFVTTGGFGANPDMVDYYMGSKGTGSYAGDTMLQHQGDGINMLLGAGAVACGMQWSQGQTPCVDPYVPYGSPLDRALSEPYLWVNEYGKRVGCEFFTNLTIPFNMAASSPDHRYFNVFDSTMVERMETQEFFTQSRGLPYTYDPEPGMGAALEEGVAEGTCFKGETLEELAEAAGINAEGLVAEVEHYNSMCEAGEDVEFFKDASMMLPLTTGPFYAIKAQPCRLSTLCGVKVSEKLEVMGSNGAPIPGLYAGGIDTGGFFATDYNHAFSGSCSTYTYFCAFHGTDCALEYMAGL